MSVSLSRIRTKRVFSEEFKRLRVKEYEKGQFTATEICRLYSVHHASVYKWINKYSTFPKCKITVVEMSESSTLKLKELQERIKELERIVGQKQINIDYLEKIIDIAKEELNIDLKKNSGTLHSNGSKLTPKKGDAE